MRSQRYNNIITRRSNRLNLIDFEQFMDLVNLQSYDPARFTMVGSKASAWLDQNPARSSWVQATDSRRPTISNGVPIFPGSGSFMQRAAGELALKTFSVYMILSNTGKTSQPGAFSGITAGHWCSITNLSAAYNTRAAGNIAHTGNRPIVLCIRRNLSEVKFTINGAEAPNITNILNTTEDTLIGSLMGLPWNNGWSIPGVCLSFCVSSGYHDDVLHNLIVDSLYQRYNLDSDKDTDNIKGYGDSNTVGGGGGVLSYLTIVGPAMGLNTVNLGISGACMTDLVGIAANSGYRRQAQISGKPGTDWILIALGTNDVNLGANVADYKAKYDEVVANRVYAGHDPRKIVLFSPMYRQGGSLASTLSSFRDAVEEISVKYNTRYFNLLDDFRNNGGDANMADTLHCNTTGRNRWAAGTIATMTA
jgi:lysophospholipase L1-like esterase